MLEPEFRVAGFRHRGRLSQCNFRMRGLSQRKVEILKGLASGEKIVKLGQYELSDGAKVHEAEHAEAHAPGGEGAAEK